MSHVIGIDIGGTFTDCAIVTRDSRAHIGKAPTTTGSFGEGFIVAIASAAERIGASVESLVADAEGIYHGCTVGMNALVEGKAAKVGLVTTPGHADTIFAMQAGRRLINHSADATAHASRFAR